jgi:antitoxin component YwqK of YwqJK toxin-antitoxin module
MATSPSTNAPSAAVPTPAPPPPVAPPPDPPHLPCEDGTTVTAAHVPDPTWFCTRADGKKHGAFFTLFPDVTIAVEGSYKDGKLHGAWTRHYPGGAVAEQGSYAAGLPDGKWQRFGRDGTKLGEYTLKAGTGKQKRWFDDGPLYSEVALRRGVPNGAMVVRDHEGHIVIKATLVKGKLHDDHEVGSKNNLRIEETFKYGVRIGPRKIWQFWALLIDETYDEHGKLDGLFTIWRDKKVPRIQGEYSHGKRIGPWVWTDKQNNKEREGDYTDGKKTGPWSEYSETKLTFQGQFTDGKPDGEFIYYDKTGLELGRFTINGGTGSMLTFHANKKVSSRTRLVNGEMQGKYEELTPRGKVIVEGAYASDRKHGLWRETTETGQLVSEIHYRRGKLDGSFKKYIAGALAVEATYKDGKAEGAYTEYRGAKPSLTGQFAGDKRTGTWTLLDANGAPTLVATYKDGVLDGPWKEISGDQTAEGVLVAGRPSGTWNHTDRSGTRQLVHKTP